MDNTAVITVNNVWCRLSGVKNLEIVDALDAELSYFVEGHRFMRAFQQGWYDKKTEQWRRWDGKKHLLTQRMVFPAGLLERVRNFLDFNGVIYDINDKRESPRGKPLKITAYKPRPYQSEAVEAAMAKGRGIIRAGTGGGKCLGVGTPVLRFDGSICNVEDVMVGDLLMGPDSQPRAVLSTTLGRGPLYRIVPKRGNSWICNDVHVLTLAHTVTGEVVDIPLDKYQRQNGKFKHVHKQFSTGVDFAAAETLPLDPYYLGLWFGDGSKSLQKFADGSRAVMTAEIWTEDSEIREAVEKASECFYGMRVTIRDPDRCPGYAIVNKKKSQSNPFLDLLRSVVGPCVRVPSQYLTASRQDRLEFLAGWIDSDGHLHNGSYDIVQKREDWANAVCFLARSLGFRALKSEKWVKDGLYHRVSISGETSTIPVRIPRKKAALRRQKKNALRTGFDIEFVGEGAYAGFELDGDGRFLLGDFTVTHNTLISSMIIAQYNVPTMIYVVGKDLLHQFYEDMVKCFGPDDIGIIGDGYCDVRRFNVCSVWTAAKAFELKSKVSLDDEDWTPDVVDLNSATKGLIKGVVQGAQLAIFDEAHFLACDTIQSIFKAGKSCRYMFGLTGTDWRDDGADLLLESVCGPRIFNMPASKLIETGYLVPPKIAMLEAPPRGDITNRMSWPQVYSRYITNNDVRNRMLADSARQLVSMGRKVLILVRYLKHGKNLVDMLDDMPIYFVNGEMDGSERKDVKERFEAGEFSCLVASSVFDIGVDIPSLDALILGGGGKSTVRALQRIGRVIRLGDEGKKDAIVVDIIDNAKYLDKHSATRIAVYETEPFFQIKFPRGFDRRRLKRPENVQAKIK